MSGTGGRLGWSWIFVIVIFDCKRRATLTFRKILEGGLTVVVGIVSIFSEPQCPGVYNTYDIIAFDSHYRFPYNCQVPDA